MEYISAVEAADKWDVSLRQVERLLSAGRIPGAVKHSGVWLLPCDVTKPHDLRIRENPHHSLDSELSQLILSSSQPMPVHNPEEILNIVQDVRTRRQHEAMLTYLRGNFKTAMRLFEQTAGDDAARILGSTIGIATAISSGDYQHYKQIEAYLLARRAIYPGSLSAAMAELALCTAATSCFAPDMVFDWLKVGDFSYLPAQQIPFAQYLRAKYFQCNKHYESMLAVAQTTLGFCETEGGISHNSLYLRICCAIACRELGYEDDARKYLLEAMRLGFPHGFITPFAENVATLGGLMEQCLEQEYPDLYQEVLSQWEKTFDKWIIFHNQFTKENITLILTLREYHIARSVAQHTPYSQIARQHHISVGRVKNIMHVVYGKLFISNRNDLEKYIL